MPDDPDGRRAAPTARHPRDRPARGAWRNTVEGAEILNRTGLPFIVQTTVGSHNLGELDAIADFAHDRLAAKVWNLYIPGADGARAVRVRHHTHAVRRGSRLALPDPGEVRPFDLAQGRPATRPTPVCPGSGPTPEGQAGARRGRTTWGYGRKGGLDRVTVEELERIRARMPTPKIFGDATGRDPVRSAPRSVPPTTSGTPPRSER